MPPEVANGGSRDWTCDSFACGVIFALAVSFVKFQCLY